MNMVIFLDFGFNPTFARNITYVLNGAKSLLPEGFTVTEERTVDYGLLKGLISAMRFFYSCVSVILLLILIIPGTIYINILLRTYSYSHSEIYIAWIIYCIINVYSFYTYYYDALLYGSGFVKRIQQIICISQIMYLITAGILIVMHLGIIAIVSASVVSVIIKRVMMYRVFYTHDMKQSLMVSKPHNHKVLIKIISKNAVKAGIASIGDLLSVRLILVLGSLHLTLDSIASYGITTQLINIIASLSIAYISVYSPQITEYRVQNNLEGIKDVYIKAIMLSVTIYIICGGGLVFLGSPVLKILGSGTPLLRKIFIIAALVISFSDAFYTTSITLLQSKNQVPFLKTSLFSGAFSIVLLFVLLKVGNMGVLALILAPGIARMCYQNWKWPLSVIKDLRITLKDVYLTCRELIIRFSNKICSVIG
jgi:O-antigen/teichoic acid export membrane protein